MLRRSPPPKSAATDYSLLPKAPDRRRLITPRKRGSAANFRSGVSRNHVGTYIDWPLAEKTSVRRNFNPSKEVAHVTQLLGHGGSYVCEPKTKANAS
jgi:hypothetical protein